MFATTESTAEKLEPTPVKDLDMSSEKSDRNVPKFRLEFLPRKFRKMVSTSPFALYKEAADKGGLHFAGSFVSQNHNNHLRNGEYRRLKSKISEEAHKEVWNLYGTKELAGSDMTDGTTPCVTQLRCIEISVLKTDYTVRFLELESDVHYFCGTDDVVDINSTFNKSYLEGALNSDNTILTCSQHKTLRIAVRSDHPAYIHLDQDTLFVGANPRANNAGSYFLVPQRESGEWVFTLIAWIQNAHKKLQRSIQKTLHNGLFADTKTITAVRRLVMESEDSSDIVVAARSNEQTFRSLFTKARMANEEHVKLMKFAYGLIPRIRCAAWRVSFSDPIPESKFGGDIDINDHHDPVSNSRLRDMREARVRVRLENPHTVIEFNPWSNLLTSFRGHSNIHTLLEVLQRGMGENFLAEQLSSALLGTTPLDVAQAVEDLRLSINGVPFEVTQHGKSGIKCFQKRVRKNELQGILENCMCLRSREEMQSLAEDCQELSLGVRQVLSDGLRARVFVPVDNTAKHQKHGHSFLRNRAEERYDIGTDNNGVEHYSSRIWAPLNLEIPLFRNTTSKAPRLKVGVQLAGGYFLPVRLKFLKKVSNIAIPVTRYSRRNAYTNNTDKKVETFNKLMGLFSAEAERNCPEGIVDENHLDWVLRKTLLHAATYCKQAIVRSEQLLKDTCEEIGAVKTENTVENETKTGYALTGSSGTEYFVTEERPYRIFHRNKNGWSFICVVSDKSSEGVGKDELVTRLYALRNDSDSAADVSTLHVPVTANSG